MKFSVAMTSAVNAAALKHLIRPDGQEDLCFALWYPSQGRERKTALTHRLVLPKTGERSVHGNVSFTGHYFERALGLAVRENAGLALLHSHVGPGWQGMSGDDIDAELGHSASTKGATGHPLLGLTIGTDGAWSARLWEKLGPRRYERCWCQSVRVVGERLRAAYYQHLMPKPGFRPELTRTVSAWGFPEQAHMGRLRVGIIGAGSVGSLVAESLARMGIAHITLIDFDIVEAVNLGCLLHAYPIDAQKRRPKVLVLADALKLSATASPFQVDPFISSIVEEEGFRQALDCDVLFSCVDRPWPRFVLNFIAYAHLIPVVDGGVSARQQKDQRGLLRANWRAHVAAPSRKCLECLGQYDPGLVSVERDGYLDDPTYIQGLPADHALKRSENVFAFSAAVASSEILQFLRMVVVSPGLSNPGAWSYDFVTANTDVDFGACNRDCCFSSLVGKGDNSGVTVTGRHPAAEKARSLSAQSL